MKRDDFSKRYIIKLFSAGIIILLNVIITFIIPRAFSLEEYGYYTFNTSIFTSIVGLANLSTSNALNTKYAKRNNDIGLLKFYAGFFVIMTLCLNILVIGLYHFNFVKHFFGSQNLFIIILGLEVALLNKLLTDVISIFDSIAVTRFPSVMQGLLKAIIAIFVLITYFLGKLNLYIFYIGQIIIFGSIITVLCKVFLKDFRIINTDYADYGLKSYIKEFYIFCKPLVIVGVFSQLLNLFMDSSLLNNSGAETRAMYGAACQFNALLVFVFSPYAELSKREFAVKSQDQIDLKHYFMNSIKIVMWGTAFFAVFIAIFADWIIPVLFGENYISARISVILIMVYTIYQAWGQVMSSFLLSLEKTKESAWLGLVSQSLLFVCVLIFLRPNFIFPTSLGAEGLSLSRAIANVFYVIAMIFVIARQFRYSALSINLISVFSIVFYGVIAGILHVASHIIMQKFSIGTPFVWLLLSSFVYLCATLVFLWKCPEIFGVNKEQLKKIISFKKK